MGMTCGLLDRRSSQYTNALSTLACRPFSGGDPGMPLTARVERGPSRGRAFREHEGQPGRSRLFLLC